MKNFLQSPAWFGVTVLSILLNIWLIISHEKDEHHPPGNHFTDHVRYKRPADFYSEYKNIFYPADSGLAISLRISRHADRNSYDSLINNFYLSRPSYEAITAKMQDLKIDDKDWTGVFLKRGELIDSTLIDFIWPEMSDEYRKNHSANGSYDPPFYFTLGGKLCDCKPCCELSTH